MTKIGFCGFKQCEKPRTAVAYYPFSDTLLGYSWAESLLEEEMKQIEEYKQPGYLNTLGVPEEIWNEMLNPEAAIWVAKQPTALMIPQLDIQHRLNIIEQQVGGIPISLRAWYEIVGSINLTGTPPSSWRRDEQLRGFACQLDPLRIDPINDEHIESV